jgi:hypothetical protein
MTGQYSFRSPIFTPISSMGLQIVQRQDSFLGGADMDVSPKMTLIRRPGFGLFSTAQLAVGDFPQKYFSFKNTAGTIRALVETPSGVYQFTPTAVTKIISKNTTSQGSMSKVANTFYYCDGNNADTLKWDGRNLTKWGINAPDIGPSLAFGPGTLSPVNGGYQYCYVYQNANTGHISSTSPVSASTLNGTNQTYTVSGDGSTDPQVTNIQIYRTEDGGETFFLLTTIPNTASWSFADETPDSSLNIDLVVIPGSHSNDPPPSGADLAVFYQNRYFIASGSQLSFSGGPDITNGVPEECFAPANVLTLPGNITAFAGTSQGLIVFTQDDAWFVDGNSTLTYGVSIWQANFGVNNQNCVCQDGDLVNVFTSQSQWFQFSASTAGSLNEIGFPVRDALGAFNPVTVSTTIHRSGSDEGLFISNGTTQMFRYSLSQSSMSTAYNPVGGCGAITSIETSTANYQLMMGRNSGANVLLSRTPTANNDDGQTYPCNVTLGSLVFASPHQTAEIEAVMVQATSAGTFPTVAVLLNEIAGTFTVVPPNAPDPPLLPATSSIIAKQHALAGAQTPLARGMVQSMQIQLSFPSQDAQTEVLGVAVI